MPGLVETSTSLARVEVKSGTATIQFLTRSSVETAKEDLANMIMATFELAGANVRTHRFLSRLEPQCRFKNFGFNETTLRRTLWSAANGQCRSCRVGVRHHWQSLSRIWI